jgi:hypothetical protein
MYRCQPGLNPRTLGPVASMLDITPPRTTIDRLLWNLKAHFHVHKSPQLDPSLCHIDPVYTQKAQYLRPITIVSSVYGWIYQVIFSLQAFRLTPPVFHLPRLFYSPSHGNHNSIMLIVQIIELLITYFLSFFPVTVCLIDPNILRITFFSNMFNACP